MTERKEIPLYRGLVKYFPDALEAVAHTSFVGNEQHHPGSELHWDKPKSADHPDALLRHMADHASGTELDDDGIPHLYKVAWRALAWLQTEIESEKL